MAWACSTMLAPSDDKATDSDWRQYSVNRPATASTATAGRQAARARVRTVPGVRTAAWVVTRAKTTVRAGPKATRRVAAGFVPVR